MVSLQFIKSVCFFFIFVAASAHAQPGVNEALGAPSVYDCEGGTVNVTTAGLLTIAGAWP